jgi:hypothetical protein
MRANTAKAFIRGINFNPIISSASCSTMMSSKIIMSFLFSFFYVIVWKVMEMCFRILVQEKRVTQRELFYKLLCDSPDYFTSQLQVNRTIQG